MEITDTFLSSSSSKSSQSPFLHYVLIYLYLLTQTAFGSDVPFLHLPLLSTWNLSTKVRQITLFKRIFYLENYLLFLEPYYFSPETWLHPDLPLPDFPTKLLYIIPNFPSPIYWESNIKKQNLLNLDHLN